VALFVILTVVFNLSQVAGGQTWDELADYDGVTDQVQIMLRLLGGDVSAHFSQVRSNYAFYGIVAVLPAYLAERWTAMSGVTNSLAVYTYFLHATAFASYLLTIVLTYLVLFRATGARTTAAAGSGLLALYPLWLGYSFFNHKDMPTASAVLFAIYAAILMLQSDGERRAMQRAGWLLILATIFTGGLKIPALVLIIPAWTAVLAFLVRRREFTLMALLAGLSALGVFAVTPVAWTDPFNFMIESLLLMSRHGWNGCTLTGGTCMAPHSVEWSAFQYMAKWYLAQLPLLVIVGAVLGLLVAMFGNTTQITIGLSLLFPLIMISLRNSTLYDGLRQLLFTIPLIFILAAMFWHDFLKRVRNWRPGLVALLLAAFFVWDNVAMFPYNYVSFNLITRQTADNTDFETDYWGFSLREAAQLPPVKNNTLPILGNPVHLVAPFAAPPGRVVKWLGAASELGAGSEAVVVSYTRLQPVPSGCVDPQFVIRQLPAGGRKLLLSFASLCRVS
jgi:hypothetical protein